MQVQPVASAPNDRGSLATEPHPREYRMQGGIQPTRQHEFKSSEPSNMAWSEPAYP
jgi:hypothetical protein